MKKRYIIGGIVAAVIAIGAATGGNDEPKKVDSKGKTEQKATETKKDFKVGDAIEQKGYKMTVTGVEKKDSLGEFSNAPEGSEYVIANVEFENVGEKNLPYNNMYFSMQNSDNVIVNTSVEGFTLNDSLKSGELAAGGKVAGKVVFEAKKGDNNLTLIYKPLNFSNVEIKVALQ
ncbi:MULTISPECIES: DUF4352 domain-containing protein [Bacillus]|uniref:DUF4352 domain-containing protein n=1 Tax=Bacillus cereus TaxID=1396 RepID=A0A164N8R0_BACCE|nr:MULTISPECIES: DUF4352 domain-containing protein [Bacillus]KZD62904.1 hypothetical protein B4088_3513 [Bacillus cereus]NEK98429.1 DUF4352 domain-containing protein [Bacillus mobilis]TSI09935.1 DUF4352 domain-containing protein [Bacillus sp. HY001]